MSVPNTLPMAVASLPPGHAAVVEGALDPELRGKLAAARLPALPLYLEGGTVAVWSGPVLVDLAERGGLSALLEINGAAVIWSWPAGVQSLRRHLRSINLVEVPADTVEPGATGRETVIFRYWDPQVLAALLPLLSPAQQARFLGEADGLAFDSRDSFGEGAVIVAPRPAGLPAAPRGLLRFSSEQMAALSRARVLASRRRIGAYLRETAPEQTRPLDDRALAAEVERFEREGQALGLATERDLGLWASLQLLAGGALFAEQDVRDDFDPRLSGRTPSETMRLLFDDVVHRLERAG